MNAGPDLREYRDEDLPALLSQADNPRVAAFLRPVFPSPYTPEDARRWLVEGHRLPGTLNRVIDLHGALIGNIGVFWRTPDDTSRGEIGLWLGEDHWGHGHATSAIGQFTTLLQREFGTRSVFAQIAEDNPASRRAFERCGYLDRGPGKEPIQLHCGLRRYHTLEKILDNRQFRQ